MNERFVADVDIAQFTCLRTSINNRQVCVSVVYLLEDFNQHQTVDEVHCELQQQQTQIQVYCTCSQEAKHHTANQTMYNKTIRYKTMQKIHNNNNNISFV